MISKLYNEVESLDDNYNLVKTNRINLSMDIDECIYYGRKYDDYAYQCAVNNEKMLKKMFIEKEDNLYELQEKLEQVYLTDPI